MAYRSDRQRVEAVLLPQMMWAVVEAGVKDKNDSDFRECQRLLVKAMEEPVLSLSERDKNKVLRRTGRLHLDITEPYRTEKSNRCDKVALIVYFLIKAVTDDDYLVRGKDSAIQRALELYLPAIQDLADETPLFESSRKHARKVLDHLQSLGFFPGVPFPD